MAIHKLTIEMSTAAIVIHVEILDLRVVAFRRTSSSRDSNSAIRPRNRFRPSSTLES
jgi:hypothetical protein